MDTARAGIEGGCTIIKKRRVLNIFLCIVSAMFWIACALGYRHLVGWPPWLSLVLVMLFPLAWWRIRRRTWISMGVLVAFLVMQLWVLCLKPGNDRDWRAELSRLPRIDIEGDAMTIHDLRHFKWRTRDDFDAKWETRTFDLGKLTELELMVEPFGMSDIVAHTMLGFGFEDGQRLVVSVEGRREEGEAYSLVAGALRQFELIYVFSDERDALPMRADADGSQLYAYPIRAEPEFIRNLLQDLAASANALHTRPRFYRSITHNCTTAMVKHVDRNARTTIGLQKDTLFPARTGRLIHRMGFMKTDLPYNEARKRFRLDEHIRKYADHPDFSHIIRIPSTGRVLN